jgi:hypothetical protein
MFLSKRNGISYLWYRDDAGNEYKVRTGARVKADMLHLLRDFDQESRHRKDQRILLSSLTRDPFEYLKLNMAIGTLRIWEGAFHHFLRLHGSGTPPACQWVNKLATLALAPIQGPASSFI